MLKFGQNLIKIVTKLSTDFSKRAILFLIYLPADKGKYVLGKIRILEYWKSDEFPIYRSHLPLAAASGKFMGVNFAAANLMRKNVAKIWEIL